MASTNKTTNYELSQFLGTDKPAWLSDYNQDMSKIDTQMKANADAATAAGGSASTANTAIGTMANLTTTVKTSLVAAVNEVNTTADTAQTTASSAATTAGSANIKAETALTGITNISSYLSLSNTGSASIVPPTGVTVSWGNVLYALNSEGSFGKIYSNSLEIKVGSTGGTKTIRLSGINVSEPETAYTMAAGVGFVYGTTLKTHEVYLRINTDGTVDLRLNTNANETIEIFLPACVYFFEDFGDTE